MCFHEIASDDEIHLRPLRASDAEAHLSGCDGEIIDRLGGRQVSTLDQMAVWAEANGCAWANGGQVGDLGIEDVQTGQLAGCVRIQRALDDLAPGQVNLTYALYPK